MASVLMDIDALRQETPGCEHVLHLNNAGASLMPLPVVNAMMDYLTLESQIGGYEAAAEREADLEKTYHTIAQLLNAYPNEIAFVENATRAWDMAFYAITFKPGDKILTSVSEYASNYIAYLQVAQKYGVQILVIPNDETGQTSVEALESLIDPCVKLISITHIPTNNGLVNPAVEIGQIARKHRILYLLDACQSVGQMPMDVQEIGCDMLSATGRKYLRGPRGTGFLYVRKDRIAELEPPLLDLHAASWVTADRYVVRSDARRFENWESNYAGKIGLEKAVGYALNISLPTIWQRIQLLATELRNALSHIRGVQLQDLGRLQCGIVTFTVAGAEPQAFQRYLRNQDINISISTREYSLLDMEARGLDTVFRASVHYYNTQDEIQQFCQAILDFKTNSSEPLQNKN